ncbi:MAG: ABC transporter substrate-binding protein [Cumulibacter sp.]
MGTRHDRRLLATSTLVAIGALALAGCGEAPQDRETKATSEYPTSIPLDEDFDPNATFRWAYTAFATGWDPIDSTNGADINFWAPVYDRLLEEDSEGNILPMLATEYTSADDLKSLTLTLREGLAFSDGEPFNAEAVKFNLDRAIAPPSNVALELPMITSVEVIDEYTVKINVDGGLGSLPMALTARGGIMVSPKAVSSDIIDTKPVGIGPYLATDIVPGDNVTFVKSEDYWEPDAQRVAKMEYRLIADDQARYNALVAGEIDGTQINPDQIVAAEKAGIAVTVKPSVNFLFIALNTELAPFDDPEVRTALSMAIDRQAIADGVYDGHCTPSTQMFQPGSIAYDDSIGDGSDVYPYDPEAAKKILEDAGVDSTESFINIAPNVTIYTKIAEIVQDQWDAIGLTSEVKPAPPAQVVQEFGLDMTADVATAIYPGVNDPNSIINQLVAPSSLMNPGHAEWTELLDLAAEASSSLDDDKRQAGYQAFAEQWMTETTNMIPICHVHLATGFADNVSNVAQPMSGASNLRGVAVSSDS